MNKSAINLFTKSRLLLLYTIVLLMGACTTTKNTGFHRGWHNMNARYNGYFLAKEAVKEAKIKIEAAHKEDFTRILPLTIYPTEANVKDYEGDFDSIIKQSTDVIHRHAITTRKTKVEIADAGKWIDDNYTIIGLCNFYKKEYISAFENFEYVSKKYPDPEAKYSGAIWKIKTLSELGKLSRSQVVIDELRNAEDFPEKRTFARDFALATTDNSIKRKDYSVAITNLKDAIELTRKKKDKARYYYILAQLYEKQKNYNSALENYVVSLKLHPSYEIAFSAEMKKAKMYVATNRDSKEIKRHLLKMAKDGKNKEYRDQIYFALGEICYNDDEVVAAIDYLNQSIENSVANETQKAESFLKLGDIYFEKLNYVSAEVNYDSAITFLPGTYPNYEKIAEKKENLADLVYNLNIINLQDSLQVLAQLSDKERRKAVDRRIKQVRAEEAALEEDAKRKASIRDQNEASGPSAISLGASKDWYFYNPATISFGSKEFEKKWGDRSLEDNWRRVDKIQEISIEEEEEEEEVISKKEKSNVDDADKYSREFYMKDIPLTEEAIQASTDQTIDAYYNVGLIYKEQFSNNEKSTETFEELLKFYPENKYKLTVYYHLYRTYLAMQDFNQSEYYKQILLKDHPNTAYAKIIKNPNYANDIAASKSEVEDFYNTTYQAYLDKDYIGTIANCEHASTQYANNSIMPKFALLRALSIGETQRIGNYENALNQVLIDHPSGQVAQKARELLDKVAEMKPGLLRAQALADSKFTLEESDSTFWMLVGPAGFGKPEEFEFTLRGVTNQYFEGDSLVVANDSLDSIYVAFTTKSFATEARALEYFYFFDDKQEVFSDLGTSNYYTFIISARDYKLLVKNKKIGSYASKFIAKLGNMSLAEDAEKKLEAEK